MTNQKIQFKNIKCSSEKTVSLTGNVCLADSSEEHLFMLSLEDKYIFPPSSWMLAQAFKDNRDAALSVRNQLVKELTVYKPYLRQHPFNKYFMMIDPRSQRINEIDKFLNFTRVVNEPSDSRITQDDIERAKLVPIESLYDLRHKHKKIFCNFHNDLKNPSAIIYKDSNRFHCFTCDLNLDSIEFIRKLKGIGFVEAVKELTRC